MGGKVLWIVGLVLLSPILMFLFASNASLAGRIYMTFSGKEFKPCINTVTAFYNKYHICSNCEDFINNPDKLAI